MSGQTKPYVLHITIHAHSPDLRRAIRNRPRCRVDDGILHRFAGTFRHSVTSSVAVSDVAVRTGGHKRKAPPGSGGALIWLRKQIVKRATDYSVGVGAYIPAQSRPVKLTYRAMLNVTERSIVAPQIGLPIRG